MEFKVNFIFHFCNFLLFVKLNHCLVFILHVCLRWNVLFDIFHLIKSIRIKLAVMHWNARLPLALKFVFFKKFVERLGYWLVNSSHNGAGLFGTILFVIQPTKKNRTWSLQIAKWWKIKVMSMVDLYQSDGFLFTIYHRRKNCLPSKVVA